MKRILIAIAIVLIPFLPSRATAAELVVLDEQNWSQYVPKGKEVDAIYGDHVLRSDQIVAVVARAVETRNANMTVKNVGGALIDLTLLDQPSDQLSVVYPHVGDRVLNGPVDWREAFGPDGDDAASSDHSARIAFQVQTAPEQETSQPTPLRIVVGYQLNDGDRFITVRSKITNPSTSAVEARLQDGVRADGEFRFGTEKPLDLCWSEDRFWRQAYGIQPVGKEYALKFHVPEGYRSPRELQYTSRDGRNVKVPPQGSILLTRRIYPAASSLDVLGIASRHRGVELTSLEVGVRDGRGAVVGADVEVHRDGQDAVYGTGRTNDEGRLATSLPEGKYRLQVASHGRTATESLEIPAANRQPVRREISLPVSGYVAAEVNDESGTPIPCRVVFKGTGGAPNPNFGPDSAIYGVRNLQYTPNGRFTAELPPGRYEVIISHGPEYDAVLKTIDVQAGETYRLEEKLIRTVDTRGWISADLHGHSSPSGDNTASQRGRVLNLLAEHIEFAPCTEHNRISTYVPHLKFFRAQDRIATCCGMELTGQPLPLNHQNAFPLIRRPRTQDGGAPVTHVDPVVQIERLAMWDDASDKLVQINHPNVIQMLGDKDQNGQPDGGFERMFHFMDVMEVHPPGDIFRTPSELYAEDDGYGNRMFHWLQLLNLGYRVPAVVNTDAHWNYYGSGGLRNYIRSAADNPAEAKIPDLVRESELGHIVISNGPFLEVDARADDAQQKHALPGDDLATKGGRLTLRVRAQCPNWMQVNRVQLFINGRPADEHNYTRRRNGQMFANGPVVFDQQISITLPTDAHLVVAITGEGAPMGDVYGPPPDADQPNVNAIPVAVANPIYVDVDGDGFKPNGDMLGLPLPVQPGHQPSHGHDHANFHRHDDPAEQAHADRRSD
jgi:hypothetical protein